MSVQNFVQLLENLKSAIAETNFGSQSDIAAVGAEVEGLIHETPEELGSIAIVLRKITELLQSAYIGAIRESHDAARVCSDAMDSALSYVSESDKISGMSRITNVLDDIDAVIRGEAYRPQTHHGATLEGLAGLIIALDLEQITDESWTPIVTTTDSLRTSESLSEFQLKCMEAAFALIGSADATLESRAEAIGAASSHIEAALEAEGEEYVSEPTSQTEEPQTAPVQAVAAQSSSSGFVWLPSEYDQSLLGEFITECKDYMESAEASLLALETNPSDKEAVNSVFRLFHTVKGTAAFLGLTSVAEFAHRAESLLCKVRDDEIRFEGYCAELALKSNDLMKALVAGMETAMSGSNPGKPGSYDWLMEALLDPTTPLDGVAVAPKVENVESKPTVKAAVETEAPANTSASASAVESTIRVRTDRLDRLINMVGELVVAQAIVSQDDVLATETNYDLSKKIGHAGKIVREIQEISMSMRMVPLRATFQKMNRLVRDLSQKVGKNVTFITVGDETEIDRNMVDVIGDPLVHMVRNAIDHGIESPEDRAAAGKTTAGTVRLAAYHQGGSVVVELTDDGKGLNKDRIIEKAIEKGLIESEKGMSDSEIFNLIFAPGFSTAAQVTDVSGRGVGMDVVRRNIESLRGKVEISSEQGRGSTFSIQLPLTLAITDGMLVKVGPERYLIPTVNIHLTFKPEKETIFTMQGKGEMVMLRGEMMPVYRLDSLFGITGAVRNLEDGLLVVVDDGDKRAAFFVDELVAQHQVVAKALGDGIGHILGVSGGAILGDGRVGLILDVNGLLQLARSSRAARIDLEVAA
ncbi:MAG: chemotaxis protein CheA [Fimbriimonadales bacterium]